MSIESSINNRLMKIGFSIDDFVSYQDIYDNIVEYVGVDKILPNNILDEPHNPYMEPAPSLMDGYWLLPAKKLSENKNHWMAPQCINLRNNDFIYVPTDELYGYDTTKEKTLESNQLSDNGILPLKIAQVCLKPSLFGIFYVKGVHPLSSDFEMRTIHPYGSTFTLHGMIKMILEWQWAFICCDNREPMAILANSVAEYLDLNVLDQSNQVVADLINLGDMQVASYIRTGEVQVNEENWPMPVSVMKWILDSDKINLSRISPNKNLYIQCRALRRDINRLTGNNL